MPEGRNDPISETWPSKIPATHAENAQAIEPVPLDKILHPEMKQARKLPPRKTSARETSFDLPMDQAAGT
jgi:hypothetical protein